MKWDSRSVTIDTITKWKEQYGSVFFVKTNIGEYFFRPLKKREFDFLVSINDGNESDAEDALLSMALLYPKFNKDLFDDKLAGEVEFLIRCINSRSGFSGTEDVIKDIETARGLLGNLENQIIILVCKAFPHLTLEDIKNLTYEELIRYLSISEAILDMKLNIEKPTQQKPGVIDFDADNKGVEGAVPFGKEPPQRQRGDVGK